jgi:hypothetical protein
MTKDEKQTITDALHVLEQHGDSNAAVLLLRALLVKAK